MKYKHLIFDLYGTLADIHTEDDAPEVWEKLRLYYGYHGAAYTAEELRAAYRVALSKRNAVAGRAYEGYPDQPIGPVLEELFAAKGITEDLPLLADTAAQIMRLTSTVHLRLYPHVLEALAVLRAKGLRLYLLSNAQAAYTRRELTLLGLEKSFDAMYLSSDFGIRKPDAGFIGALLREQQLNPAECLMIGNDMTTDIAGAQAAGVDGLYTETTMAEPVAPEGVVPVYHLKSSDWNDIAAEVLRICGE